MQHSITIPDQLGALEPAQLVALLAELDAHLAIVYPLRQTVAMLATAREQADALADAVAEVIAADEPTPWETLADRVAPGQRVVWTDGNVWRNTSRAWLPIGATPATWPQGWAQETGLPADVAEWAPGEQVWRADDTGNPDQTKAATLRSFEGTVYRCNQSHTTQAGWEPPLVPALWSVV